MAESKLQQSQSATLAEPFFTYGPVSFNQPDKEVLKETEIGPIPESWEIAELSEVLSEKIVNGAFVRRERFGRGILFANVADTYKRLSLLTQGLERVEASPEEIDRYILSEGDLIFVRSSLKREGVGQCCIAEHLPEKVIFDCHLMRVRVDSRLVFPKFLAYFAVSKAGKDGLIARSKTTTMTTINQEGLSRMVIPLPSLSEQRAIANVLSNVQQAKEATDKVIAATRQLKQSLMHHLFTYGPVPFDQADKVELTETEIGEIPKCWEVSTVGKLASVRGGKHLPKGHSFAEVPTPYPYIRVVDFEDNTVRLQDLKYLTQEDHSVIAKYIIKSEDIYVSIAGTTGVVGVIPEELDGANLTENAARLVLHGKPPLDRDYLMYWLASDGCQREIKYRTTKTSQPKLALARIKEIPVPIPPLTEQQEMSLAIRALGEKISAELSRKKALECVFSSLLATLMTGKIRVGKENGYGI